jgi:hypothetical protein
MLKSFPILFALALVASTGHAADNCEPLRAKIEAQIAGTGVTGFTITTVDAAADVPGKVVGTCDNGTKKIVYARGTGPVRAAPTPTPAAPAAAAATAPVQRPVAKPKVTRKTTREEDILTECKDGTVSMGGSCK